MTEPFYLGGSNESGRNESGCIFRRNPMPIFLRSRTESGRTAAMLMRCAADAAGLLAIIGIVCIIYMFGVSFGLAP
jgi:hypothetical protein